MGLGCCSVVVEGVSLDYSQSLDNYTFPRQNLSTNATADSAALDIPARITLPTALLMGAGSGGEISIANLLVTNVEQFFPSTK